MYCPKCGAELTEGAKFCGKCGTAVQPTSVEDSSKEDVRERTQPTPNDIESVPKKKRISRKSMVLIATIALLCIFGIKFRFGNHEIDGIYYKITSGSTVSVSRHLWKSYSGEVRIPDEVKILGKTYRVTSIKKKAFQDCKELYAIVIPSSVTTIGDEAFHGCYGLSKADFASIEHLCSIKFGAYSSNPLGNANLYINGLEVKNLTIPDDVTSIGNHAFDGCKELSSVYIPNSVTSIGNCAFSSCDGLTSITIPNSVKHIGVCAFDGCDGLESVYISNGPDSIEIGRGAFSDCDNLQYVSTGNRVKRIGNEAFLNCKNLRRIDFFPSVAEIGQQAFQGCTGLTHISIPCHIEDIGPLAFSDCTNLRRVTIDYGVKRIGRAAFSDCPIESVVIPSSVTEIGEYAFSDETVVIH